MNKWTDKNWIVKEGISVSVFPVSVYGEVLHTGNPI